MPLYLIHYYASERNIFQLENNSGKKTQQEAKEKSLKHFKDMYTRMPRKKDTFLHMYEKGSTFSS